MQPPFRILCQLCLALSQRAPKDKELELSAPLLPLLGSPVAEMHWAAGMEPERSEQNFSHFSSPCPHHL